MSERTNLTSEIPGRKWLVPLALIVLCCIPFLRGFNLRNQPAGEDEIYWIGQAYYFHLAFEKGDWTNPDWQLLPARENPVLGKYVIGLGLRLGGVSITNADLLGVFYLMAKDRPNAWGNVHDHEERSAVVKRMDPTARRLALEKGQFELSPSSLMTARLIMLILGVISVLAVFVLTAFWANKITAFLAALMFSLHPAVVAAYTEVGVDILAIAFSLLSVICFVLIERNIWQRCSRPRLCRALVCIGGGLSLAFAVGSKLNAIVVGLLGAMMCFWFAASFVCHRDKKARSSLAAMFWLLLISLVVFVISSPANFPNPAKGIWALYADQQRSLEVQKGIPTVQHPLYSIDEKLHAVMNLTAFHPVFFTLIIGALIFQILKFRKTAGAFPMIILWWLIAFLTVTAWIPFVRPRYVLPLIAPSVILVCCATQGLLRAIKGRDDSAKKSPQPS